MGSRIENFIQDHLEEFDDEVPSEKFWDQIQKQSLPLKKETGSVIKMRARQWAAVAAVLICAVAGLWFLTRSKSGAETSILPDVAKVHHEAPTQQKDDSLHANIKSETNELNPITATNKVEKKESEKNETPTTNPEEDAKEEIYHFAKIIEIKDKELKKMSKDEPLLYKQFSSDVTKLDSAYHFLESRLSTNQNSEELIEQMIQNLQLQMRLLNHQLDIIKKINHAKKSVYEKAYQSI
ncbi:MAG: hypothetical protein JST58_08600 [Bacteroidetes bacterium]|nr:hypothetical protein [Bacteroidota bacterium]